MPSSPIRPRLVRAAAYLAVVAACCLWASPAWADEIVVRDLNSGETSSVRAHSITSESWSEVKYKERERSAEKSVPTITVVEVRRSGSDTTAENLKTALVELDRGNYREAAEVLRAICGGGWNISLETGERNYISFSEGDPKGARKRPPWMSEYAHFHYAKAKYLQGKADNQEDVLREAYYAIDDVPVTEDNGKKSGGFLGRFAGGNSRFYAEAMWLKANILVGLARYRDAETVFAELYKAAIRVPLGPRWAYEGKIGPGVIAEAQGNLTKAVNGYNSAGTTIEVLLKDETRRWLQEQYGRYYSLARMRVAAVKLKDAEKRKAASAFADLRNWIKAGMPEELRRRGQTKGYPPNAVKALVAGARDPAVQAVAMNGIGLAFLNEPKPKYEEAMIAFKGVIVKYFQVAEQPARALYYLAKAAKGAAEGKKPEVRDMYVKMSEEARKTLRRDHAGSVWATK
jgi:hypothetical protein